MYITNLMKLKSVFHHKTLCRGIKSSVTLIYLFFFCFFIIESNEWSNDFKSSGNFLTLDFFNVTFLYSTYTLHLFKRNFSRLNPHV